MAKKRKDKNTSFLPLFVILLAVGVVLFLHWQRDGVSWYKEAVSAVSEETAELSSHSVLMVDQRGCGISEGHVITFGIREKRDCLKWIEFINAKFNGERKIILTGISMGAATVLSTTALNIPESVVGVIADCGYSSPKKIIKHVLTKTRFPNITTFLLIRIGSILFGGFDICRHSQEEELKSCRIPVFFVHGEDDKFVPCDMSLENYNSVPVKKKIITVPGAKHGMSYLLAEDRYVEALKEFFYGE